MLRISLVTVLVLFSVNGFCQNRFIPFDACIPGSKTYNRYSAKYFSLVKPFGVNQWIGKFDEKLVKIGTDGTMTTLFNLNGKVDFVGDSLDFKNLVDYYPDGNGSLKLLFKSAVVYNALNIDASVMPISAEADIRNLNPITGGVAFVTNDNLFFLKPNNEPIQITTDGSSHIVYGQSVHRNEFGIENGIFWSPNGLSFAFYRMDQSMVTDYPLVDISATPAVVQEIKYPMAGQISHQVTIGVFDTGSGQTIFLNTGEPVDRYFTNISWTPDSKHIYVAEINRGQDTMWFNSYNSQSGSFEKTLFTETSNTYVEPQNPALFLPGQPDKFVWQSRRNGFNHLYLYNTNGDLLRQITSGDFEITGILGFSPKNSEVFVESTESSPLDRHIYKVNIANGKRQKLTKKPGTHSAVLAKNGTAIFDNWTSETVPSQADIIPVKAPDKIKSVYVNENPLKDFVLPEVRNMIIKSADKRTDLFGRMMLPFQFDSTKKYPVIVYVYGGPHAQLVTNRWEWSVKRWQQYMAYRGFITFTVDNRGSANRGQTFEAVIHRQLGKCEMEDQMEGVKYLAGLGYADTARMALHGWSYGGYMTISMLTHYPGVFKVGVAGGPVIDWKYYEIMYGERYMDKPSENREGYANCSLLSRAGLLQDRLMIIHGTVDPTVVWQNSLAFVKSCVDNHILIDYMVYPGHPHNVIGPDRVHLMETITRYITEKL